MMATEFQDDDDVYYYICERLKLEGETENMGVCTCVVRQVTHHLPEGRERGGERERVLY